MRNVATDVWQSQDAAIEWWQDICIRSLRLRNRKNMNQDDYEKQNISVSARKKNRSNENVMMKSSQGFIG